MNRRELLATGVLGAGLAACAKTDTAALLSPDETREALSGFAVNAESWWRDIPFEARFDKAAKAGFSHVEFWFIDSWKRSASELKKSIPEGLSVAQIVGDAPELAREETRRAVRKTYKRPIGLELWAKDDDYEAALLDIVALSRNI